MSDDTTPSVDDYVDVRDIHPDFKRDTCYRCGEERVFKRGKYDYEMVWNCQTCNRRQNHRIEIPCWECGSPLRQLSKGTECAVCGYENRLDKDAIINRLSSDMFAFRGKPGVLMGECPFCGDETSVNGGPDGELVCDNDPTHDFTGRTCFYAGQYSDEWFAYGQWLLRKDRVDVHSDA